MALCVIHTADWHGRLQLRQVQRLRALREERRALLLDAGDALGAPNLFVWPWRDRTPERMAEAGYAAICLGNREYGWTRRALEKKLKGFSCPVLATNLLPQGPVPSVLQRWAVLETAEGVRVGVFGLCEPLITPGSFWERWAAARYLPPLSVVGEALAVLREQAEIIVALTHFGRRPEAALAAAYPEIDLILAGHWHTAGPSLERIGRVTISRTFVRGGGVVILTQEADGWRQEAIRL